MPPELCWPAQPQSSLCYREAWHQVDGVATVRTGHTTIEGLPSSTTALFSTSCSMDFELQRGGGTGEKRLEIKTWAGTWNHHPICSTRRDLGTSQLWQGSFFKQEKSKTMPKNMPTEPRGHEKLLGIDPGLPPAVTEEQGDWSLWSSTGWKPLVTMWTELWNKCEVHKYICKMLRSNLSP